MDIGIEIEISLFDGGVYTLKTKKFGICPSI